jgi:carboxymethylenebutenolidase
MRSYLLIGLTGVALIVGATFASGRMEARRVGQEAAIPAGAVQVVARLAASPRHAEWVTVKTGPNDSVRAWLVYPERRDNAPVVVVIHEIFGLSNWVRGVADQLAADGFIAIAPDLLTMRNLPQTAAGEPEGSAASAVIGSPGDPEHQRKARLVAEYAMKLPAAAKKYGIVGYCWGGGFVWQHAIRYPDVAAGVSYYGPVPNSDQFATIKAPILGLYGSDDARVNVNIPRADSAMKALGKKFEHTMFEGARHGFLRAQDLPANLEASKKAWPMTTAWFRTNLR